MTNRTHKFKLQAICALGVAGSDAHGDFSMSIGRLATPIPLSFTFSVNSSWFGCARTWVSTDGVPGASAGERFVKLQIDGSPGPLEPGSFTVQNVPGASDTFYGLYHPDPTSVTFSGFDTTRLSPPGAFTLTSIAPERVVGSFQFRANPRVEGEIGPSGATFADITSGRVDLTYR